MLTKKPHDSWVAVYHRLCQLRTSLVFVNFYGSGLSYVEKELSCIKARRLMPRMSSQNIRNVINSTLASAKCQEVMHSGKHCARFTVVWPGIEICIGIMRPLLGGEESIVANTNRYYCPFLQNLFHYSQYPGRTHSCFYSLGQQNVHTNWNEESVIAQNLNLLEEGKKITLFLDLDQGELKAYFNCSRGGWMQFGRTITGLAGEFCWASALAAGPSESEDSQGYVWDEASVHVERLLPIPAYVGQ